MPRNYDTTNGQPFVYFDIESMRKNPETQDVTIHYSERMALKSADGVTRFLSGFESQLFEAKLSQGDMQKTVPVVDLATGEHHPSARVSYGQVMSGIIAAIRSHQEQRDAALGN